MPRTLTALVLLTLLGCTHSLHERTSQIAADPSSKGQLAATEIKDHDLSFVVYSSTTDVSIVKNNAASLILAYRSLTDSIGIAPSTVSWSEIVLTRDEDYLPPRDNDAVVRWPVPLTPAGALGAAGKEALFSTIPHEQVHAIQKEFGELPRWFSEGMAEWAGLKATRLVAPALYVERKRQLDAELASTTTPPALASWGGVKPKPEAILRQLTPEQKRRMATEPGYFPSGPFTFGPDDFISDESNTLARYAASLQLFERVEQASSPESMRAWFEAVRRLPSPKKTSDIVRLANEFAKTDISEMVN